MPKTCLIAAHDPWFIQLLKIYSEECGFRVVQAFDMQEVLTKALHEKPAAILLQSDLPGTVKSRDLLKLLHRDPNTSQIPVFVFSWQGLADEMTEGATAQLIEPVTYDSFVNALQAAGLVDGNAVSPMQIHGEGGLQRSPMPRRRNIHK
jgi:DNA-binding response OmpR family regulator